MLKEHQAKYEALTEEESRGIMEEILSMKIGISADANVDDNEEAEQMIRAITHGDIDNSVRCMSSFGERNFPSFRGRRMIMKRDEGGSE